jgi:hypothetical protein
MTMSDCLVWCQCKCDEVADLTARLSALEAERDALRVERDTLEARRVHVEREWLAKYQDMERKWATAVAFGCVIESERDRLLYAYKYLRRKVDGHDQTFIYALHDNACADKLCDEPPAECSCGADALDNAPWPVRK